MLGTARARRDAARAEPASFPLESRNFGRCTPGRTARTRLDVDSSSRPKPTPRSSSPSARTLGKMLGRASSKPRRARHRRERSAGCPTAPHRSRVALAVGSMLGKTRPCLIEAASRSPSARTLRSHAVRRLGRR
nr:MAG: hypothetical protein DIU78_01845 [Pseudomonadota bacterium]